MAGRARKTSRFRPARYAKWLVSKRPLSHSYLETYNTVNPCAHFLPLNAIFVSNGRATCARNEVITDTMAVSRGACDAAARQPLRDAPSRPHFRHACGSRDCANPLRLCSRCAFCRTRKGVNATHHSRRHARCHAWHVCNGSRVDTVRRRCDNVGRSTCRWPFGYARSRGRCLARRSAPPPPAHALAAVT
jgi:hypothetical protein